MQPGPPAGKYCRTDSGLSALSNTSSQFAYGAPVRSDSRIAGTAVLASVPACRFSRWARSTKAETICAGRSAGIHHTTS